jgi:hypothetical protein
VVVQECDSRLVTFAPRVEFTSAFGPIGGTEPVI